MKCRHHLAVKAHQRHIDVIGVCADTDSSSQLLQRTTELLACHRRGTYPTKIIIQYTNAAVGSRATAIAEL